jgi:hypothetical protein
MKGCSYNNNKKNATTHVNTIDESVFFEYSTVWNCVIKIFRLMSFVDYKILKFVTCLDNI